MLVRYCIDLVCRLRAITILFFLCLLCFCLIQGIAAVRAESLPSREELLQIKDDDMTMGCKDAPYTLIEYSSLSCTHCANFHKNSFRELRERLINTGQVRYVYRDYPTTMSSLTGSILAHCLAGENSDRYFELLFAMFNTQTNWVFQQNYADALLAILKLYGVEEDKFKLCLKNQNISGSLTKKSFEAGKIFDIKYTPTFFLNGEKIEGEVRVDELEEKIKKSGKVKAQ